VKVGEIFDIYGGDLYFGKAILNNVTIKIFPSTLEEFRNHTFYDYSYDEMVKLMRYLYGVEKVAMVNLIMRWVDYYQEHRKKPKLGPGKRDDYMDPFPSDDDFRDKV
jgi:hypothetical protein